MIYENKYFKFTLWILSIVLILFYFRQLEFITKNMRKIFTIIILPTIIASFFYYLLRPLVKFLEKLKVNKTLAVTGVFLILAGLISILSIFAGRAVVEDFRNFYQTILKYLQQSPENVRQLLNENNIFDFSFGNLENNILDSPQMAIQSVKGIMSRWVSSIAEAGTIIILIPVIAFFFLKDDESIYNRLIKIVPKRYKERVEKVSRKIDDLLQKYFLGQLIVAGFLGLLTYIGYLIIGIPNALFLAIFSMIFSIIPLMGPVIGVIPAMFIAWTVNPIMILKVLIVLLITQQLEGNVVRPKVMGNRLDIHPLAIIFLVIIAVSIYGFMGAFFVIPFYGMIRIIVKDIVHERQE